MLRYGTNVCNGGLHCNIWDYLEGRQWAVCGNGPFLLDFDSLRDRQGIFEFNAEIPSGDDRRIRPDAVIEIQPSKTKSNPVFLAFRVCYGVRHEIEKKNRNGRDDMTVHFAAVFPNIGACVISDTAVSMSEIGESRKRVQTVQKIFFTNRGTGVVVAAAGDGELCSSLLVGLAKYEHQVASPERATSLIFEKFPSVSNGRSASFLLVGRNPAQSSDFQVAILKTHSPNNRRLLVVPESKEHAVIGVNTEVWNAEFCGYLQRNISKMLGLAGSLPESIWSRVSESREGFALGIIGGALIGLAEDVIKEEGWSNEIGGPWMATCIPISGPIFQTRGEMYNGAIILPGTEG